MPEVFALVQPFALVLLPGAVGGLIRGAVGISKEVWGNKQPFDLAKLFLTLITAALVGSLAAVFSGGDWRIALLAGFAGSDLLESLYKAKLFKLSK